MTQTVHLKTLRSLGQRTRALQVMQFPVAKSRPPELMFPLVWPLGCDGFVIGVSSSDESEKSWRFFLLEKRDGKGWLMDLEWVGRRGLEGWMSDSEELES